MNIMAVSPYIRFLRPKVGSWIQQSCSLRNSLKIGKDIFELDVDVKHFCKDDLRIKAMPDRLLIEGKYEKKLDNGVIIREFSRKYMLPSGVDPRRIQSELTNEGILTIKAPRDVKYVANDQLVCETLVPIIAKGEAEPEAKDKKSEDLIQNPLDSPSDKG